MTGHRVLLVIVWSMTFFISACGSQLYRSVIWQFIIPDHYQGFLVIEYACPTGSPLPTSSTIPVYFQDNGSFCTSSTAFSWEGKVHAKSRSGRVISQSTLWTNPSSYGLYGDGLLTLHGPPKREFEIYWVGDLSYLSGIRNTAAYKQQLDTYLQINFGLQRP